MKLTHALVLVFAVLVVAAPQATSQTLIGVDWPGYVYYIDIETGAARRVAHSGWPNLNSLESDREGNVYTQGGTPGSYLLRLNVVRGLAEPIRGEFPLRGLALAPEGRFYSISGSFSRLLNLRYFERSDSTSTIIGRVPHRGQALEISRDGQLYGWSREFGGLSRIDPETGASEMVSPGARAPDIQGLAFHPDGTLYGAGTSLYRIDVETGETERIGGSGIHIRGIAFLPLPRLWIDIDIEPGKNPNVLDARKNKWIGVAIYGSDDFDVTQIDPGTLSFGPSEAEAAGRPPWFYKDVDGDGHIDLGSRYRFDESGITSESIRACLKGFLLNDRRFVGCDRIVVRPRVEADK